MHYGIKQKTETRPKSFQIWNNQFYFMGTPVSWAGPGSPDAPSGPIQTWRKKSCSAQSDMKKAIPEPD